LEYAELNPDRWFRTELYSFADEVRVQMAAYVRADPDDLVFVENASNGLTAVFRSIQIRLNPGGKILLLDLAYGMVKTTVQFLSDSYGIPSMQLHIPFPTSQSQIISLVRQTLEDHPDIAFASFSHITSTPAIILPVKELVQLCRNKGVLVLIDGAHVLGNIPLNIPDIDPDFYITNGHKWMYTPKGSAILWVRKDKQSMIFPTIITGAGMGKNNYQKTFSYQGTTDYTSYMAFPTALQFRADFGDQAIMDYMHNLASEGGTLLANLWGTEKLVDDSMIGAMVNVRIPSTNADFLRTLDQQLYQKFNTYVPVFALAQTNIWYTRVSAQIYTEISDFQYLGDAVLQLLSGNK